MLIQTRVPKKYHIYASGMVFAVLLVVAFLLEGCAGSSSSDDDPSVDTTNPAVEESANNSALSLDAKQCFPLPAESMPGGQFTIALQETVRPDQAPVPTNLSERMVFALLYETLVKVACDGSVTPGLAENWSCTDDGTTWVFRIRDNAILWDGTRLTAGLVKQAWIRNQALPSSMDHVSPWAWLNAQSKSVKVIDAQRLAIQLPEPQMDFPLLLTHPATAVAISRPGWRWPVGSGPGRLHASTPAPIPDLNVVPNSHHPAPPTWNGLRFLVKPNLDPRNLIALDPDILVVNDNISANFFRGAPGFRVSNLPWQRLYLLVCSPKQNPTGSQRWLSSAKSLDRFTDLSGVATRPWDHLVYPSMGSLNCPQLTGPVPYSLSQYNDQGKTLFHPDNNTLLFCETDPGSRELALRLAALGDVEIKAQGAPLTQLNMALEQQSPGAFILAINRHYPSGCLQLASLLGRATWLQNAVASNPHSDIITPLLLTHPYLVHKEKMGGIELEFDGTLNLSRLGITP